MSTIGTLLAAVPEGSGTECAAGSVVRAERECLLGACLARDRAFLRAFPEREVEAAVEARYRALLARRSAGVPLAYLLARRGFWTLDLEVDESTLIPRPETELLVEWALELDLPATATVVDLGTGAGAIALALASERPKWQLLATDIADDTLALARRNAERIARVRPLAPVDFARADWCDGLPEDHFDLVVCNPPYIAEGDAHLGLGDLRFEPRRALASGPDGLTALREIVRSAPRHLRRGSDSGKSWLLLEHGWDQGPAVCALLEEAGFRGVGTRRDLAGHGRATGGWLC